MPVASSIFHTFPNGRKIELFYISTLAEALGRTSSTIRKWEISGVIPDPMFRDSKRGDRLYSKKQIDAVVKCAEKAKIKQGCPISNSSFSKWVHKALYDIKQEYLIEGGYKNG